MYVLVKNKLKTVQKTNGLKFSISLLVHFYFLKDTEYFLHEF